MADYTYATSTKKIYDEAVNAEKKWADTLAKSYAEKEKASNTTYSNIMNGIYAEKVKAQEETAAADTKKAHASYGAQFDANAASELARRRVLKEQMANYGLGQSGFNATNQTALSVARSNADAATRTARQQAVDDINEELRKYKADSASELATTLAQSERESADRVLRNEQALQSAVHQNAMDYVDAYSDQVRLDMEQKAMDVEEANLMKSYVDDHNKYVYENMLDAYNGGNTALAEEYAKQLWQLNANGTVTMMPFDTAGASAYAKAEAKRKATAEHAKTQETTKETHTAFGFPQKYSEYIEDARKCIAAVAQAGNEKTQEAFMEQAINLLCLIEDQSKNAKDDGYMDEKTFQNLLRYVGITKSEFTMYKGMLDY